MDNNVKLDSDIRYIVVVWDNDRPYFLGRSGTRNFTTFSNSYYATKAVSRQIAEAIAETYNAAANERVEIYPIKVTYEVLGKDYGENGKY